MFPRQLPSHPLNPSCPPPPPKPQSQGLVGPILHPESQSPFLPSFPASKTFLPPSLPQQIKHLVHHCSPRPPPSLYKAFPCLPPPLFALKSCHWVTMLSEGAWKAKKEDKIERCIQTPSSVAVLISVVLCLQ